MKALQILSLLFLTVISSCSSIKVASDYDTTVDFSKYKTFAFHTSGIEKVQISEFDKKRIMKSIESELNKKGITKSETPDLLVMQHDAVLYKSAVANFYHNIRSNPLIAAVPIIVIRCERRESRQLYATEIDPALRRVVLGWENVMIGEQ